MHFFTFIYLFYGGVYEGVLAILDSKLYIFFNLKNIITPKTRL